MEARLQEASGEQFGDVQDREGLQAVELLYLIAQHVPQLGVSGILDDTLYVRGQILCRIQKGGSRAAGNPVNKYLCFMTLFRF